MKGMRYTLGENLDYGMNRNGREHVVTNVDKSSLGK